MIVQILQGYMVGENGLSENQSSFRQELSAIWGAHLLKQPAGNRSREGGHPQRWKAQIRREMADEMA